MRISAKARYGLAAMIYMGQRAHKDEQITTITVAEDLGISKIYLEQIFSSLRKAGLLTSMKGPQGGYKLVATPDQIPVYDIIYAIEASLFEKTDPTVAEKAVEIDQAMGILVWEALDQAIANILKGLSLKDLVDEAEKHKKIDGFMFYI